MRLRRGSPTKGLEFEIEIPEGIDVHRDVPGQDLVLATGDQNDPITTSSPSAAAREGGPMTRDEHVRRVRADLERGLAPHLVDEGPIQLAGHEASWTIDAIVRRR